MQILFVGGGAMGSALRVCWETQHTCTVIDPHQEKALASLDDLDSDYVPDVIVLAVKPQVLLSILPFYAQRFQNIPVQWVSIAAGITRETLAQFLPQTHLTRCMPNLSARYGTGVSILYGACPADIVDLFKLCGFCLVLEKEDLMNAATAITGSGPAYVYHMVEALSVAAQKLGFSTNIADLMARHTVMGAGVMLQQSEDSPEILRTQVTSPGGTTQAGLNVLMLELEDLMARTTGAALNRAEELGKIS